MPRFSNDFERAYSYAFNLYLRYGIVINIDAMKRAFKSDADYQSLNGTPETRENHSTPFYIWRTSGDDKVRPSHAVNNGKIFSWDTPPAIGHPGENFNCRCTAEPYYGISYTLHQHIIRPIVDAIQNHLAKTPKWNNTDMSLHFYTGNGSGVSLTQIVSFKRD